MHPDERMFFCADISYVFTEIQKKQPKSTDELDLISHLL